MTLIIREYVPADENSWLRCRVLSFLGTAYFDNVLREKPAIAAPGFALVAVDDAIGDSGTVVGVMDVEVDIDAGLATIETVAVHPDHQHRGIGRSLLTEARARVRGLAVSTIDAWTRDDEETLRWYRAVGFAESEHYLHVYANLYADAEEPKRAVSDPRPGLGLVIGLLHGKLADEAQLRTEFSRVHVCRRFAMEP